MTREKPILSFMRKMYRRIFPRPLPDFYAKYRERSDEGEDCFTCNVCGSALRLPRELVTREAGNCPRCHCYSRLRAMVLAVMEQTAAKWPVLDECKPMQEIKGLGCSDSDTYSLRLARAFDYTNTFYDRKPRLDLMDVDWSEYTESGYDFVTCTDVLEHVPPPVSKAFANLFRLLKPGGVLVMSVPTTDEPDTKEHFPNLSEWEVVEESDSEGVHRVLVGKNTDGSDVRCDDLCFHGGEGFTLEMRVFSRDGLIRSLKEAGFEIRKIYDQPAYEYGISLEKFNFIVAAQRPHGN